MQLGYSGVFLTGAGLAAVWFMLLSSIMIMDTITTG
jgi:hypothetical protein